MNIQEQFNLVAKEYDGNRRHFIPCFDDYYAGATDFVAKSLKSSPKVIFDLGSGTGLLASFWYKYFPTAKYILADIAEEMLSVAKKRFENLPNVEYKVLDYSGKLPEETPDVIASALSIHHLEDEVKRRLFMNIYKSLPAGGVFVNYDQFCSESLELNEKIEKYWIDGIKASGISEVEYERWLERKKLDRECSVQDEISWLKEAGFANVECIYLSGKFAVIVAVR